MSEFDQVLKYAEEALFGVSQSKTEREKQLLLELACTWTRAAVASERTMAVNGSPAQARLVSRLGCPPPRRPGRLGGLVRKRRKTDV